jgi:hypothetical protein
MISSPPVFSEVSVTWYLVLCVCFVNRCFPFGHFVVCSSSINGFWLSFWYLQTLIEKKNVIWVSWSKKTGPWIMIFIEFIVLVWRNYNCHLYYYPLNFYFIIKEIKTTTIFYLSNVDYFALSFRWMGKGL